MEGPLAPWAAGSVFLLLQACLGLEARGSERKLVFCNPVLPEFLQEVRIRRLRVGEACVDLLLTRHERGDIAVTVVRREGSVEVVVK
jgi:hypothetical protein